VGPKACISILEKRNVLSRAGIRTPDRPALSLITIPTTLFGLPILRSTTRMLDTIFSISAVQGPVMRLKEIKALITLINGVFVIYNSLPKTIFRAARCEKVFRMKSRNEKLWIFS